MRSRRPGVGIRSADRNGGYSDRDGTSRSSPQVAGGAAIILALNPSADVFDILRRSGTCPNGAGQRLERGVSGAVEGR